MTLAQGHVLEGKYVIQRRIAEGGMSTVYLGVNSRIGKDVAVKVLHPGVACLPDVVERFEREARIVSRVKSAHVADVYDFGELPNGDHFMVMEYLEGESLASMIEREHTIAPQLLALIASQILSALCAAHAAGVVHRDLKPENVIVTTRGAETLVKVVDFGISKCVEVSSGDLRKTAADALMGTPLYMSPEQARGHTAQVDERTDIYALGVILYEATAGEPPLSGENVQDVLFRVALEDPKALEVRVPSVDPALAAIVRKAMAKLPADRFTTAEEMLRMVEEWRARYSSSSLTPLAPSIVPVSATPASHPADVAPSPRAPGTPFALSTDASSTTVPTSAERGARGGRRVKLAAAALALVAVVGGLTLRRGLARDPVLATTLTSAGPSLPAAAAEAMPSGSGSAPSAVAPAAQPVALPPDRATVAARAVPGPKPPVAAALPRKVASAINGSDASSARATESTPPPPAVEVATTTPGHAPAPPQPSTRRAYRATFE